MTATKNFISHFIGLIGVTNDNLLALGDHNAINGSRIMGGSLTTPTESFNLQRINAIGQFD
jgi:hypothetical protein